MKIITVLAIVFTIQVLYSQDIKIVKDNEGYGWILTNYTLPDFIITYRIYDKFGGSIGGASMDPEGFYTVNYFPSDTRIGRYTMIVYISIGEPLEKSRKILFTVEFEIK